MAFSVTQQMKTRILEQYDKNMACYPRQREAVDVFLRDKAEDYALCLRYLYGHLPVNDMVSFGVERLAGYVEATLAAYDTLEYMKGIPLEILFPYVLYHRVNSECLDGSRAALLAQILPYVQGKTLGEAALAVNYWCYAHATYTPADDRTLGPLAVMRRAMGRCGEESVLAVAALRSVGIPARQVYCPRWSHCDDNHAWVEVWADGDWHYFGACEPEPVSDKGWFTAAASRAMLVHTKQYSLLDEGPALQTTPIYKEISCTAHYADVKLLTVQVVRQGMPLPNAAVAFQIVNYCELFTLHEGRTDENGYVRFETGLGDLCVFVHHEGSMLLQSVDMREQTDVLVLDLAQALPERIAMDLVPPVGRSDVTARTENEDHERKLLACETHRAEIVAGFALPEAAGNWHEVQAFLNDSRYSVAEKEEVLLTLRPKDWVDITCETLMDALDTASSVRGQYPANIFRDYILAPRIADEMLLPERAPIRNLFPDGFADPVQILGWLRQNMRIVCDYGVNNYYPSAYGCLRYRQVPAFAFDMVFVALCRAFRFPARLAPDTGEGQWLAGGRWCGIGEDEGATLVELTLENPAGRLLNYSEHISIGCWDGTDFVTLRYPGLTVERDCRLFLQPGWYRIITTTRQIDGTASVLLRHIRLETDERVTLELPADQTAMRLKQVPLVLPDGPVADAIGELSGQGGLLIFADPGSEPTEHLLQEMLECAGDFNSAGYPVRILVDREAALQNTTLQRVNGALSRVRIQVCRDPEGEAALHRLLQVGDLRLPFAVSVDALGQGIYACANYNIRMAQTLLRIHRIEKKNREGRHATNG